MKKLFTLSMLSITISMATVALETPQTPDINYETLRIEQTVADLQAKDIQRRKLLGKSSAKLEALGDELKAKIAQIEKAIKEKISAADLEKLKVGLKNLREKISTELEKLK